MKKLMNKYLKMLKKVCRRKLGALHSQISPDTHLTEYLKLDLYGRAYLAVSINEELGLDGQLLLDENVFGNWRTIGDIVSYLDDLEAQGSIKGWTP